MNQIIGIEPYVENESSVVREPKAENESPPVREPHEANESDYRNRTKLVE